jgi:TatD DNase family protein
MIFDTHCHYNLEPLSQTWQSHWEEAQSKGVQKSIVVGTSVETSQLAVTLAQREKNLWPSVAIHPIEFNELPVATLDKAVTEFETGLQTLLSQTQNKIVAIGETGLDYFHLHHTPELTDEAKQLIVKAQKKSLQMHIRLAQTHHLPLLLHVRDQEEQAYWDTLELLKAADYQGKFVLHCISGPAAYLQEALSMGAYIGVAGNITYKNAEHLRDLVRQTPKEKVLLETDAPYLPPQEFRGKVCEPWMISLTATFIEKELGIPQTRAWENAHTFFDLH